MRIIVYLLLLLTPYFGQAQGMPFVVKGKVGSWNAPAKVYLKYAANGEGHTDSAILKNGHFEIKGRITEFTPASLLLCPDGGPLKWPYDELMFYIDKGIVQIDGRDSMKNALATGNRINEDNNGYNQLFSSLQGRMDAFYNEMQQVPAEEQQTMEFQKKTDSIRTLLMTEADALNKEFIKANRSSFISLTALQSLSARTNSIVGFDSVKALYSGLSPALKQSIQGKKFLQAFNKQRVLLVGMEAPGFAQPDSNGVPVNLASFRGQYVLVNFWASWCKPCRKENKELVKIYEQYKDRNFTIFSVSVDHNRKNWLKAVKDDQLLWMQVSDLQKKNAAGDLYDLHGVPSCFLLDPNGKIIAKNIHEEQLAAILKELL